MLKRRLFSDPSEANSIVAYNCKRIKHMEPKVGSTAET